MNLGADTRIDPVPHDRTKGMHMEIARAVDGLQLTRHSRRRSWLPALKSAVEVKNREMYGTAGLASA